MMGHVHARGVIEDRHGIQVNVTGRRDRIFDFLNTVVLYFNRLFFGMCCVDMFWLLEVPGFWGNLTVVSQPSEG